MSISPGPDPSVINKLSLHTFAENALPEEQEQQGQDRQGPLPDSHWRDRINKPTSQLGGQFPIAVSAVKESREGNKRAKWLFYIRKAHVRNWGLSRDLRGEERGGPGSEGSMSLPEGPARAKAGGGGRWKQAREGSCLELESKVPWTCWWRVDPRVRRGAQWAETVQDPVTQQLLLTQ